MAFILSMALLLSDCMQQDPSISEDPHKLAEAFTTAYYRSFNHTKAFRNAKTQAQIDSIKAAQELENAAMTETLKKYLLIADWPAPEDLGRINLVEYIKFAPQDFLDEVLPRLKQQVLEGKMDAQTYAEIVDGKSLNEGGLQIYGSIIKKDRDGNKLLPYILDIDNTNAMRAEIGLPELTAYLLFK